MVKSVEDLDKFREIESKQRISNMDLNWMEPAVNVRQCYSQFNHGSQIISIYPQNVLESLLHFEDTKEQVEFSE